MNRAQNESIQSGTFMRILPILPYMFPTPHSRPPPDIFFEHTVYAIMPPKQQEQEKNIDKEV